MCSVIEIKNANEYYIRYHGPESMQQQPQHQQHHSHEGPNGNEDLSVTKTGSDLEQKVIFVGDRPDGFMLCRHS